MYHVAALATYQVVEQLAGLLSIGRRARRAARHADPRRGPGQQSSWEEGRRLARRNEAGAAREYFEQQAREAGTNRRRCRSSVGQRCTQSATYQGDIPTARERCRRAAQSVRQRLLLALDAAVYPPRPRICRQPSPVHGCSGRAIGAPYSTILLTRHSPGCQKMVSCCGLA